MEESQGTFDSSREETEVISGDYLRNEAYSGLPPNPGNIIRLGELFGYKFAVLRGAYLVSPLLVVGLVLGVNGFYLYYFAAALSFFALLVILLAASGLFFGVVMSACLDPGYLSRQSPEIADLEATKHHQKYSCLKCFTTAEDKVYHDSFCDLCVHGYDHFCIVLGNVIGQNNIRFFYSIFVFYVVNVVALVIGIVTTQA